MTTLNVDPRRHAGTAKTLADTAVDTQAALPQGWVTPAAGDPISVNGANLINQHTSTVYNAVTQGHNVLHPAAHQIAAAMTDYSAVDSDSAEALGGSGDTVTNPVPTPLQFSAPTAPTPAVSESDLTPMSFAQQVHGSNANASSATQHATALQNFSTGPYTDAANTVDSSASSLSEWTPVGQDVAGHMTRYRGWMDQVQPSIGTVADAANGYQAAFNQAQRDHPTADEISSAQQELSDARSEYPRNPARTSAAMTNLQQVYNRSNEAITNYSQAVDGLMPGGLELPGPPSISTGVRKSLDPWTNCKKDKDWWKQSEEANGQNGQTGQKGETGSGSGSQSGTSSNATSSNATTGSTNSTGTGTTSSAGATSTGTTSASNDATEMAQMLPMMAQMASQNALGANHAAVAAPVQHHDDPDDDGLGSSAIPVDEAIDDGGVDGGDGGGTDAELTAASIGPAAAAGEIMPRTSVIEPATAAEEGATGAAHAGTSQAGPYMPPMSPNRGAGAKDRDRVVAWHPDRLMYVDDTPHTDLVLGEAPSIAPTVTPPTPNPANPAPTQSGGAT